VLNSPEAICDALREAVVAAIPDAQVTATANSPGHFVFAGKSLLQQQQLVLGAIRTLMAGDGAPVHAIDRLRTKTA
jgi:ABC-type proline/glycine betaine transport system permease subunit